MRGVYRGRPASGIGHDIADELGIVMAQPAPTSTMQSTGSSPLRELTRNPVRIPPRAIASIDASYLMIRTVNLGKTL